ncbi:phosphatidylinositol-specific phospholipase C domain-containing protein [Streptomyces decoyicus]|uniref:phosphatidylinositol-specific phospholipase C domain-containing protein n=1 Tax=Streptomyces decoyicus TaxID=249567 RepID=UPI0036302591
MAGEHGDTAGLYDDTAWGFAKCQAQSLEWQLNNGVRFVDVRFYARDASGFEIFHGNVNQHLVFGSVLAMCRDFLRARPTETILMRISQTKSSAPVETFKRIFESVYLDQGGWKSLIHARGACPRADAGGHPVRCGGL